MSERHTLLLADDSTTIQRVVELTFANENIDVISVSDGDRAMDSLRASMPDIVLADVGMPGPNGYELARHIKGTPELAHIPVLLLTGAFEPVDQAKADEVGCDGTLVKPFEPQVVIQRVKALLPSLASSDDAAAGVVVRPEEVTRLDDYFDTLDQALAARAQQPPARLADIAVAPAEDEHTATLSHRHPTTVPYGIEPERAVPAAISEPILAGAFSALLAAEQSGAAPDAFTEWLPEEPPPPPEPPTVLTSETIDLIVGKVIERLSHSVVREAVTAVASATAERLVREEIERIKSNIK